MKHYLFAKFLQNLSADELMENCKKIGIDGPTAMIRDGYWVTKDNQFETLPAFVKTAAAHGCEVAYADTDISMSNIDKEMDTLKLFADCGIKQFRVAYTLKSAYEGRIRQLEEDTKRMMADTAAAAEKAGIQAIVQIHGYCYPHNPTSAYTCIRGLDPKHIGIKLDYGNNMCQEGYELPSYGIPLLGEYIAALSEKDGWSVRHWDKNDGNKGWSRQFAPAFEGQSNYKEILAELKKLNFQGPGILMPFYFDNDPDLLQQTLVRELAYLKNLEAEAGL